MNNENLWKNFLEEISKEINETPFNVWFSDLSLVNVDDNNDLITIQVPMDIHRVMLSDTYYNIIENTFLNLTGKNYKFKFVLESENIDSIFNDDSDISEESNNYYETNWDTNLNKNLNFENFVVGNTNRLAYISARAVAEAPGKIHNPLFIYGKSGLGKTHLMHAIGNYIVENSKKRVLYCTSDDFMTDFTGISNIKGNNLNYAQDFKNKYRNVDVLIIDDIQYLVRAEKTQQEFFNTFNALHKMGKQIIISSDKSPNDLKLLEERLTSRFMWGLPVDIWPPDYDLKYRIIKTKLNNTSISKMIDDAVIEYIANSCENDVRHIEGTINKLIAYTAMMVPDRVTLDFAVEALKDFVNNNIYSVSNIEKIQMAVASHFGITVEDLKGKKRSNKIAYPRQIGMYLCRIETDETFPKIGLEFGGRNHATVIFAYDKISNEIKTDEKLKLTINEIKNKL